MKTPARILPRALRSLLPVATLLAATAPAPAAALLKYNFNSGNTWPSMAGYFQTAGGTVTSTATVTSVGTIDTLGSSTGSSGIKLLVDSSSASGAWSAGVDSGVLNLLTANSITNTGLLTLSFSLSASASHPVLVEIESYNSSGVRSGGLSTIIHPAAPNFYQRYALDLSTMSAFGAGAFNPTDPKVRIHFEISSTEGGDGWSSASGLELDIDNVNYSSPKYYVQADGPGNDHNNGLTESTPFQTPTKAANVAAPGDIIVLMGSDADPFISGSAVSLNTPGVPEAWIVLRGYPGQHPVMQTTTAWQVINLGQGTSSNQYTGSVVPAYIEIRGITVRGNSSIDANGDRTLTAAYQPYIGQSDGRSNCNGISVFGRYSDIKPHDIRIANNIVEYNAACGIGADQSDRIFVESNISRYNCWWTIYAPSGISILTPVNFSTDARYRMLIQGNECYGNECMVPWAQINSFSDGNGIIIDTFTRYSYSGRTLVQNNLSYNNGGSGIHAYNSSNVDIVQNTAINNSASTRLLYGQIFENSSTNIRMFNNVMAIPANPTGDSSRNEPITSGTPGSGSYFQNNLYYAAGDYIAPPTSANYTPNIFADPQFLSGSTDPVTNDFHIHSTSQARNNSQIINFRTGVDHVGRRRFVDIATDRGALQTQAGDAYAPVFTPQPGNFTATQSVQLSSDTTSAKIVYTTDGSTPTVDGSGNATNGSVYTSAISVGLAKTLKAIAWKSGLGTSYVSTAAYTFKTTLPALPAPTFLPPAGAYAGPITVALLSRTAGAYIRYTTDGSTPTSTHGTLAGSKPVSINYGLTLQAVAFNPTSGRPVSPVASASYFIDSALFETELIQVSATSGDTARVVSDSNFSGGAATILDADATGDYVTFTLPNVPMATYDVHIGVKTFNTRGIVQLAAARSDSTNFVNIGAPQDLYNAAQSYTDIDLGNWSPASSSDKSFRFTVTGKNAASGGYTLAIDYITLVVQ